MRDITSFPGSVMVHLREDEIRTREVLQWKGLHLFHAPLSTCSQKVRIFLNLKGVPWTSHRLRLDVSENLDDYFLGINPRGLVPTLVHDGAVHIESNDILLYLEEQFPSPALVPAQHRSDIAGLLRHEDDLHMDIRTLSVRFLSNRPRDAKPRSARRMNFITGPEQANAIENEIAFWENYKRNGIPDEAVKAAAERFQNALNALDAKLADSAYILSGSLTIIDIAWFVYLSRLYLLGYPVERLHTNVHLWAQSLFERPEFNREVKVTDKAFKQSLSDHRVALHDAGLALEQVWIPKA